MRHLKKIAVDLSVHPYGIRLFSEIGKVHVVDLNLEVPSDAEIIVVRSRNKVDKNFIDKLKSLKIIATATSGCDHIDVGYAESKNIKIIDARGCNASSAADYVLRMMLYVTDDTSYTVNLLKDGGDFTKIKFENKRADMRSKSIGLIGLGAIGTEVKRRAQGFGMHVKAYDPYNKEARNTLKEVLECDFVSLHAVSSAETRGIIGPNEIKLMKPKAILINIARAELIDQVALMDALRSKKIGKVILDVYENEPEPSPFYKENNAICTPHIAGNSEESKIASVKKIHGEIVGYYLEKNGAVLHN